MELGGAFASTSLSIGNRRSSAPGLKRRLPSSIKTGTVDKKPRLTPIRCSLARGSQRKEKPWDGKRFQIDIEDHAKRESIIKDIVKLGGVIINEFSSSTKPINFLVSDNIYAPYLEQKTKTITPEIRSKMGGILREAMDSKISVKSATSFLSQITDFKKKYEHITSPLRTKERAREKVRVHKLVSPFMKLQDLDQRYQPVYKEFINPTFKKIFVGSHAGKSVFHLVTPDELERRAMKKRRKPVARPEYMKGQCEICNVACPNLQEHYTTKEHVMRVRAPDFYGEVDALCGSFLDEIKVTGCRTLPPRQPSPCRRSPSPSSDCEELIIHYKQYGIVREDIPTIAMRSVRRPPRICSSFVAIFRSVSRALLRLQSFGNLLEKRPSKKVYSSKDGSVWGEMIPESYCDPHAAVTVEAVFERPDELQETNTASVGDLF
ncbi:hypothetical protein QR680_014597 [Steinernema hermaphroditum]|uniref:DBF4-type domain-containing protein n=1 Tax=Steinernema hermaphroditum TaxID=289476 RepID=A0AA39M4H5_9BILA|nr:hypothetical protein QR680_014597 [Steinernema hermaphroditum]